MSALEDAASEFRAATERKVEARCAVERAQEALEAALGAEQTAQRAVDYARYRLCCFARGETPEVTPEEYRP